MAISFSISFSDTLLITLAVCIGLNVAVIAILPVASLFGFTPLTIAQWGIVAGVALTIIPVIEIYKLIVRLVRKGKQKKQAVATINTN